MSPGDRGSIGFLGSACSTGASLGVLWPSVALARGYGDTQRTGRLELVQVAGIAL
jgi:hypothetical protein